MTDQQANALMPLVEAVRADLHNETNVISRKLQQACSKEKAEAEAGVHDARVALRRSLVLLQLARPWIDQKWIDRRKKNRRYFMRQLARVRDIDVLAENAVRYFSGNSLPGSDEILADLAEKRDKRHKSLCRFLAGKAALQKLGQEFTAVSVPDATLQMLPVPVDDRGNVRLYRVIDCLPVMLWQTAAVLTVSHSILAPQPTAGTQPDDSRICAEAVWSGASVSDTVLHRLRLAAKDFRYCLVFAQPWTGDAAEQLTEVFKEIQNTLGRWHDAVIAEHYLQKRHKKIEQTEASARWQHALREEKELLQLAFIKKWQHMTPAWFHTQLMSCLNNLQEQALTGCADCSSCRVDD